MAWRIDANVVRGEIDNRRKGFVTGRIWLEGVPSPMLIQLKGNAWPDLAGCLLTFRNTRKPVPLRKDEQMSLHQVGTIGDLTASRKVRVFDIPFEEAYPLLKQKLPVPEHIANSLYLEWYSEANGRVVIENTDYELTISPPAWRLTPEEEQQRQHEAAAGFSGFMQRLNDALNANEHHPPEDKEWDEFDYEKFLRESDARTDKYGELLDKYQDHPDRDRIIAREMGWTWLEEALAEQEAAGQDSIPCGDEPDADESAFTAGENDSEPEELEPNPATEGVDWVRDEHGQVRHPLCVRAFNSSIALWHKMDELGLKDPGDEDLLDLLAEFQITSAKLAGALNSLAYHTVFSGAFIVACLKRALSHLYKAQAAFEKVAPKNLLPHDFLSFVRAELAAIREEILRLMDRFRQMNS